MCLKLLQYLYCNIKIFIIFAEIFINPPMKQTENNKEKPYTLNYISKKESKLLLKKNMEVFINNVKREMSVHNITQEQLANSIESKQQQVEYLLNKGEGKGMTYNVAGRIAFALNKTISELSK